MIGDHSQAAPTSGLDPIGRMKVREIIQRLKSEGKTVFFSSHELHKRQSAARAFWKSRERQMQNPSASSVEIALKGGSAERTRMHRSMLKTYAAAALSVSLLSSP